MGKLILSAFADEYDRDFETQLKALNSFNIEYIEPRFINEKNISALEKNEVSEVKKMLDFYGIGVSSIGSPLGKIKLDGDMDGHMETAKRIFETANELGTKNVRIFSFYPPKNSGKKIEDMRDEVMAALEKMLLVAESHGVLLCHENEAKIYGERAEMCLDIMKTFGGKIRSVFDMGNFTLEHHDPLEAYALLKEHIEYFHIKDALYAGAIVPAGKGEAKIAEILSDFASCADRDVFVTLEPHLQTFDGLHALTNSTFDNPYKYKDQRAAFTDAVAKFKEILV